MVVDRKYLQLSFFIYHVLIENGKRLCVAIFFHLSGSNSLNTFLSVFGFSETALLSNSLKYSKCIDIVHLHEHASEYISAALFAP